MIQGYSKGIDVSEWQGDFDFTPYVGQFVIIRAGYWTTEDKYFRTNVKKCVDLEIPFGVYWFSESLTVGSAAVEADACINTLSGIHPDMGVWVDMENSEYKDYHGFDPAVNAGKIAEAFCERMQNAGYYTGVYCSKSWIKYVDPACSRFDHWIASWGANNGQINDDTSEYGTLLQYTSKLNGGSLDGDICYVDIDHYDTTDQKPVQQMNRIDHDMLVRCLSYLTIAGLFGNGDERIACLGSIYEEVQKGVNSIYESK